jgi:hypothetical protein
MAAPVVRFRSISRNTPALGRGKSVFSKPFEMPVLCQKERARLG